MNVRVHFYVSGRVQGVGFRYHTQATGKSLGLGGWVRNVDDGRVEVLAEGDPNAVEALVEWCRLGPPSSKVSDVEIEKRETISTPAREFEIKR